MAKQEEACHMYHDNISAIAMEKELVNHSQTRHTAIKYCFIREAIEYGQKLT